MLASSSEAISRGSGPSKAEPVDIKAAYTEVADPAGRIGIEGLSDVSRVIGER